MKAAQNQQRVLEALENGKRRSAECAWNSVRACGILFRAAQSDYDDNNKIIKHDTL
jgi:hypothetical protein